MNAKLMRTAYRDVKYTVVTTGRSCCAPACLNWACVVLGHMSIEFSIYLILRSDWVKIGAHQNIWLLQFAKAKLEV